MSGIIIGLLGPSGVGKSEIAAYMDAGYAASRYSLAAPVKEIAMSVFQLTYEQVYGSTSLKEAVDPRYGLSPREMFQRVGDAIRASLGDEIWIDGLLAALERDKPDLAVIEDVRFEHEASRILQAKGLVWKIESTFTASSTPETHPSETEWRTAGFTHAIPANGDLADLYHRVDGLASECRIFPRRRDSSL
jgi:hypothetical protein